MPHVTIPTIERAWFLFYIPDIEDNEVLRKIARSAWYEIDQLYATEPDIFIVRADVVDWNTVASSGGEAIYNIIAPASARPMGEGDEVRPLEKLFGEFRQALADASCLSGSALDVGVIDAAMAMVQLHTPSPPHNNAPGYIPTSEQMSADGPLRDNRWG